MLSRCVLQLVENDRRSWDGEENSHIDGNVLNEYGQMTWTYLQLVTIKGYRGWVVIWNNPDLEEILQGREDEYLKIEVKV